MSGVWGGWRGGVRGRAKGQGPPYSFLFVIIRYYSLLFFSVKNINRLVAARLEARWRVDTAGWIVYIE